MSKKVRILGNVKHDGQMLEEYNVYELSDRAAEDLVAAGNAKIVPDDYDKETSTYTPKKVKLAKDGSRQPGESEDDVSANENPSAQAVTGVEPKGKRTVKGGDKLDGKQGKAEDATDESTDTAAPTE